MNEKESVWIVRKKYVYEVIPCCITTSEYVEVQTKNTSSLLRYTKKNHQHIDREV